MTTKSWDTMEGGRGYEGCEAPQPDELQEAQGRVHALERAAAAAKEALRRDDLDGAIDALERVLGAGLKTRSLIEALKAQWLSAPNWDIEETDGFEAYALELHAFRIEHERGAMKERLSAERKAVRAFKRLLDSV